MSTKIYNAYRIPRENDILKILLKARNIAIDYIADDAGYLRIIHSLSIARALKKLKDNSDNKMAASVIDDHNRGEIDLLWIQKMLEENQFSMSKINISAYMTCSVFYDADYWYIKFFANDGTLYRVIEKIINDLKFEDFHYQNSTGHPEDVEYDEFEARGIKWDELLESCGGNYRGGFEFTIFDAFEFKNLVSRNYYKEVDDVYEHLAYKFDSIFTKNNDNEIR